MAVSLRRPAGTGVDSIAIIGFGLGRRGVGLLRDLSHTPVRRSAFAIRGRPLLLPVIKGTAHGSAAIGAGAHSAAAAETHSATATMRTSEMLVKTDHAFTPFDALRAIEYGEDLLVKFVHFTSDPRAGLGADFVDGFQAPGQDAAYSFPLCRVELQFLLQGGKGAVIDGFDTRRHTRSELPEVNCRRGGADHEARQKDDEAEKGGFPAVHAKDQLQLVGCVFVYWAAHEITSYILERALDWDARIITNEMTAAQAAAAEDRDAIHISG
jgi:hypothetical protein